MNKKKNEIAKNIKKIKKENIMTEEEYGGGIRSTG